jgi:hypothetical protein
MSQLPLPPIFSVERSRVFAAPVVIVVVPPAVNDAPMMAPLVHVHEPAIDESTPSVSSLVRTSDSAQVRLKTVAGLPMVIVISPETSMTASSAGPGTLFGDQFAASDQLKVPAPPSRS